MANRSVSKDGATVEVWSKTCQILRRELGEATFGSWLSQASLREQDGDVCLVAATGVARDWIRRHAWRRIGELWAQNDPMGRSLALKSKMEFEGQGSATAAPALEAPPLSARPQAEARRTAPEPSAAPQSTAPGRQQGLQERFSFETFVPGPSNEFAFAVARRVASWADGHFNPVLFHGPYGFGKTHLLNALAWEAMQTGEAKRVVYLTAERFTSTFVRAIQDRQTAAFKAELRNADLLLIDDVHFVAGKQNTQEELFHTLIALIEDGRRVVLTADRSPSELSEMEPRLRSHLQSGLVCGIEPADRALRLGILERKLAILAQAGGFLPSARGEVLQFLADRFTDSVRELEGALNTLIARVGGDIARLSLDEAQAILRPHLACSEKRVTVDQIQKAVAEHYGLKQTDIISERRARVVARPRQAAMWIAKQITTRSLPDIGRRFGGRDHTTVLHAVRRIEALKQDDAVLARDLDAIIRKLRS
ncbi:MAG: chromosomal replication initiator protein DnaA [Phenylobacterium sp.]|jgi:chromosomal replication initiator protein|uniref:chromosomal replication initiator protein DnaA n=1 Tax=Phenylobacterium sp. TaxID=1871053 RepID=UPI0025CEAEFE|nr:chromosomal replication initiator protein DnaA [Phenylobacterium sp.]MCA3737470.1 chromosomal replication initiator protein DnaA [Phenylobacterium sp.]MCA4915811.1 chromosomal replication initiator protein DnaA [Phenylobacterium sp.]MCA6242707.1 chromosomal replication initiator protein DnaA [Phenylobacterium sp.]MCA6284282.1 chromosomal replication initiator protein DnaA [Phenylobacterium sp.]MCA6292914.1 chromosomal replication initiator protein DnaA [Phenylobacterium sp.]